MNAFTGLLMVLGLAAFVVVWFVLIGVGWMLGTVWRWFEGGTLD